ncbi:MAG: hypothetical protein IPN91_14295 [Holophagaceae bacterium]|uniref:Uncharacterized protein n=1 Tax=Candidatus Geothrix odensensis TaxID=2954440 RepID=A0A936K6H1_9BACT|nr:hypothetical protein [Candidatus Geothrix odensensis]
MELRERGESLAFALGSSHGFDPAQKGDPGADEACRPLTFPEETQPGSLPGTAYRTVFILLGKVSQAR